MSKVQNPIIGRSSGKFGNAIFGTWKGINVLRTLPPEVANPQTEAQMNQRNKNTSLVWASIWYRGAYLLGFNKAAIKKSEFNVFVQQNINVVTQEGGFDILPIDPENIVLAQGTLGSYGISTAAASAGDITVTWNPAMLYPSDSSTDKTIIVVTKALPPATPITKQDYINSVMYFSAPVNRSVGTQTVTDTLGLTPGDTAYATLFFYNDTTKEVSNSANLIVTIS